MGSASDFEVFEANSNDRSILAWLSNCLPGRSFSIHDAIIALRYMCPQVFTSSRISPFCDAPCVNICSLYWSLLLPRPVTLGQAGSLSKPDQCFANLRPFVLTLARFGKAGSLSYARQFPAPSAGLDMVLTLPARPFDNTYLFRFLMLHISSGSDE
jgi:hypothetical protein